MFALRRVNIMAAVMASALLAGCPTAIVVTESGQVVGTRLGGRNNVEVFKGIPFAAPPVGQLRWQPPQPVVPWQGVRRCDEFGPSCPQSPRFLGTLGGKTSEDCLYLNVWRPAETNGEKLPVMVWIHGGGFINGTGSIYDAENLAAQGVVVVTINYRLGPLGFMAHPALSEENPNNVSGNYGILDQIAALKWVRRNIAAFDGDPDNVTIFGESAGSMSVACLLATPLAQGLFHQAIMESGVPWRLDLLRGDSSSTPTAEEDGVTLAGQFGVTSTGPEAAASLRAISADALIEAIPERDPDGLLPFGPAVDGILFSGQPLQMLRDGNFNHVPLIVGSNQDEGNLFLVSEEITGNLTEETYVEMIHTSFGEYAEDVLALYPPLEGKLKHQANRLLSDYLMLTPSRMTAQAVSQYIPDVYYYYFTKTPNSVVGGALGAYHSAEIAYVFGNLSGVPAWTPADRRLSRAMQEYWVRFAATGNPNGGENPLWPAYDGDTDQNIEFNDPITIDAQLLRQQVDVFTPVILEWLDL
ncbi:MAG TPA: carboxylesterase/lipase family protein [Candidatus Hydrogenedentes bacterium]|nr:carboxylesterase/lipase family protein [Candidatus Hydrogenedentota bacterium]